MKVPSKNESRGFFGTIALDRNRSFAQKLWDASMEVLQSYDLDPHEIQVMLDSRPGRHFADFVLDMLKPDNSPYKNLSSKRALERLMQDAFESYELERPRDAQMLRKAIGAE